MFKSFFRKLPKLNWKMTSAATALGAYYMAYQKNWWYLNQFNSYSTANCDSRKDPLKADEDPYFRSRHSIPLDSEEKLSQNCILFSGSSSHKLAEEIATHLRTSLGDVKIGRFSDGETFIKYNETVRGKDVYVIQSTCPPINDNLIELLFMISTLRRASAKSITAVIPYYGYARQDRKTESRVSIAAADVAILLQSMGVDRVIAVDLHCAQIQGFFGPDVPCDNLFANIVALEHMIKSLNIEDLDKLVVVSPDAGGVARARNFQESLINRGFEVEFAMIAKQRAGAGKIAKMDIIGDIHDKNCIILDDMIDTAGTLCKAADILKANGAKRVYAFATHGVFSNPAAERIRDSALDKVLVTNTIPLSDAFIATVPKDKYEHLSVGTLIAEVIRRCYNNESVSQLFEPHKAKRIVKDD